MSYFPLIEIDCRLKANCPLMGPGAIGGVPTVGGLSKGSYPVFTRVSEKTTENSERLGRQARLQIKPDIFRLPVFNVTIPPLEGLCLL